MTKLTLMERREQAITKRQLGRFLALAGAVGFVAILLIDVIDVGRPGGIGPAQRMALGLALACALIGLSLIPRGDAPA
ncbi:MAG: hypothetical protein OXG68_18755 [Chloroflexi bacterium]|nr:hypothetical protein [Chloroflexota bacterium]